MQFDKKSPPPDWWRGPQDLYQCTNGIDDETSIIIPYEIENPVVLLNSLPLIEGTHFYWGTTRSATRSGFTKPMLIFKNPLRRGDNVEVRRGLPEEEIDTGKWAAVSNTVKRKQSEDLKQKLNKADQEYEAMKSDIQKAEELKAAEEATKWTAGKRKIIA